MENPEIGTLIQSIAGVISLPAVILLIVQYFLNKKGADKKLEIDEDKQDNENFRALKEGFEAVLKETRESADRANLAATKAYEQIEQLKDERKALHEAFEEQNEKIDTLRNLLEEYVRRTGEQMTADEYAIFEATKPKRFNTRNPIK